jgi:hypothetical protein
MAHRCREGDPLTLVREPSNTKDRHAIQVLHGGELLGYVGEEMAEELAPLMDSGQSFEAEFLEIWALDYARTNGEIRIWAA